MSAVIFRRFIIAFLPLAPLFSHVPYYNLSCPFEWSKYSCIHQNPLSINAVLGNHYYTNMHKTDINSIINTTSLLNRRILLVGDSLMRQIFISIGCLSAASIAISKVDWMTDKGWPCHGTPNCISHGHHSGFNIGYIKWKNGGELFYQPLSGGLYYNEPLIVHRFIKELHKHKTIKLGPDIAIPLSNSRLKMTKHDVLILNLGVHDRMIDFENNVQRLASMGEKLVLNHNTSTPLFIYITTPTQHYNDDGFFYGERISVCKENVTHNLRQDLELLHLHENVNVHRIIQYNDSLNGNMHIGHGDCTHYCMPGLPDIIAEKIFHAVSLNIGI